MFHGRRITGGSPSHDDARATCLPFASQRRKFVKTKAPHEFAAKGFRVLVEPDSESICNPRR